MAVADLEDKGIIFGCTVAEGRRVECRGSGSLRGERGRRIGLEVGESRARGGGFAVEVACRVSHGGYEALPRLMIDLSDLSPLALCAVDSGGGVLESRGLLYLW